ncbi:hypothetical protein ACFL7D_00170 [candidate division KSB1 bacterium]
MRKSYFPVCFIFLSIILFSCAAEKVVIEQDIHLTTVEQKTDFPGNANKIWFSEADPKIFYTDPHNGSFYISNNEGRTWTRKTTSKKLFRVKGDVSNPKVFYAYENG